MMMILYKKKWLELKQITAFRVSLYEFSGNITLDFDFNNSLTIFVVPLTMIIVYITEI